MAKEYFDSHGVKYNDFDVLSDVSRRQEMVTRSGQLGVPVIIIDDHVIVGFDEPRISSLLGL
jgi:glutaredoxin